MPHWKAFLQSIQKNPRDFVKALINHLDPPKYVIEAIQKFEWICEFCWNPRIDICFLCERSICEEHRAKTFLGKKLGLEWYVCQNCLTGFGEPTILNKIEDLEADIAETESKEE
jgi:hypothetical protein